MDAQWISISKEFGWKFKNVYAGYVGYGGRRKDQQLKAKKERKTWIAQVIRKIRLRTRAKTP